MKSNLSYKETLAYLANVLYVAAADGGMSSTDDDVLSDIAQRIGADQDAISKARELISSQGFKMQLLVAPEARMSNLEDMVLVGLADNKISQGEAGPIEKMAKALHYSQADLNLAVRRVKGRLQKMRGSHTSVPPLPASVKPQTATPPPIRKPAAPPPPPPPLPKPIEPTPVKVPTKPVPAPEDQKPAEPEKKQSEPKAQPVAKDTHRPEPKAEPVPELKPEKPKTDHDPLSACMAARNSSASPEEYCFGCGSGKLNIWGCRMLEMDWSPGADWLRMGEFRDSSTFVFDRPAMADRAIRHIKKTCKDCPHLNIDFIDVTFDLIPSRASVAGRWVHHVADSGSEGAETVNTKENIHGCLVSKELIADGLDPVGNAGAINIIRRAVKKSGRTLPDFKLLSQE